MSLIFISLIVLILSVIVHEVAHGYAADALGDPTARMAGRLTLNPVPHIDLLGSVLIPAFLLFSHSSFLFGWAKPVPYNPYNLRNQRWGEVIVSLAGVTTNLLIALVFGLVIRFAGTTLPQPALELAAYITLINLFLGVFNLIPFPPLDGWNALRAALPWHLSEKLGRLQAQMRGAGFLGLVVFLFLFSILLAGPFMLLVRFLFTAITGAAF